MPLKFCKHCGNKLSIDTTRGKLEFVCTCGEPQDDSEADDTLLYSKAYTGSTSVSKFETFIKHAGTDPVNPLEAQECPKCKEKIARFIRTPKDLNRVFICTKCSYSWA